MNLMVQGRAGVDRPANVVTIGPGERKRYQVQRPKYTTIRSTILVQPLAPLYS